MKGLVRKLDISWHVARFFAEFVLFPTMEVLFVSFLSRTENPCRNAFLLVQGNSLFKENSEKNSNTILVGNSDVRKSIIFFEKIQEQQVWSQFRVSCWEEQSECFVMRERESLIFLTRTTRVDSFSTWDPRTKTHFLWFKKKEEKHFLAQLEIFRPEESKTEKLLSWKEKV